MNQKSDFQALTYFLTCDSSLNWLRRKLISKVKSGSMGEDG